MNKKIIAIYCIQNIENGIMYVGATSNYKKRISKHKSNLNLGNHPNEILQLDWDSYGEDKFAFLVLEECNVESLDYLEKFYIDKYHTLYPNGYNLIDGGKNGEYTPYMKERISNSRLGNQNAKGLMGFERTKENKLKLHNYNSGRKKARKTSCKSVRVYKRKNGKYRAEIKFLGKRYYLGTFETEELASIAYQKKLKELRKRSVECHH